MKVAFYSTSAEDLFLHQLPIARPLRAAGYDVTFFSARGEFLDRIATAGFDVVAMGAPPERPNILLDIAHGMRLGGLYLQKKPDIVHHFGKRAVVHGGIAARLARITWIVNSITDPGSNPSEESIPWWLLRFAIDDSEVTVARPWEREELISFNCGKPEQTNVLSGTALDLAAQPFREEPERTPVVVFVGSYQDAHSFIEAARLPANDGVAARFAVITAAESPEDAGNLQMLQEEGVVEWWSRRGELSGTLSNAHIVCIASAGDSEATIMGAATAGRPVVAPTGTDLALNTGLVVERGDSRSLAGAMRRLILDKDLRQRLGRRARQLLEETYSPERIAREIMSVYERLYEKGRRV